MLTLELSYGHFIYRDGKTAFPLWIDNDWRPGPNDDFDLLDTVYDTCQSKGLSQEQIIDIMLKIFHFRRVIKVHHLARTPVVIGLVGPRGSGKSVGATGITVLDFLLAGREVWSNMPVAVKVFYRDCSKEFHTQELVKEDLIDIRSLERLHRNGMVLLDESNMEIDDSMRTMSNVSLFFSYLMQQVRKVNLDVVYTTQNEMWASNRTRYQTTFYIGCHDMAYDSGGIPDPDQLGRKSYWKLYDTSGLVTGKIGETSSECVFAEKVFWNVPFWGAYDSFQLQGLNPVDFKKVGQSRERELSLDLTLVEQMRMKHGEIGKIALDICNIGWNEIEKSNVWKAVGVDDRGMQTRIGSMLTKLGCTSKHGTHEDWYIFPGKDILNERLIELGIRR